MMLGDSHALTKAKRKATQLDGSDWFVVQATHRDGGSWIYRDISRYTIAKWILDAHNIRAHWERTCPDANRIHMIHLWCRVRVFAIRFPSGAIYDFVLALHHDPKIRKKAWR